MIPKISADSVSDKFNNLIMQTIHEVIQRYPLPGYQATIRDRLAKFENKNLFSAKESSKCPGTERCQESWLSGLDSQATSAASQCNRCEDSRSGSIQGSMADQDRNLQASREIPHNCCCSRVHHGAWDAKQGRSVDCPLDILATLSLGRRQTSLRDIPARLPTCDRRPRSNVHHQTLNCRVEGHLSCQFPQYPSGGVAPNEDPKAKCLKWQRGRC